MDGIWTTWEPWQTCNVTCGGGRKLRERSCTGPFFGGRECNGSATDIDDCNTHECPGKYLYFTYFTDSLLILTLRTMYVCNCSGSIKLVVLIKIRFFKSISLNLFHYTIIKCYLIRIVHRVYRFSLTLLI